MKAKEDVLSKIESTNFIKNIIDEDINLHQKNKSYKIQTRFPPEPNGYLHIGHAKAICLNFGLAEEYKASCNLRFDDTNPVKEDTTYVDAIREDIKWLGYTWSGSEKYASDYFDKFYHLALELIEKGKAYICELSPSEMREYRGTLTQAGKDSPFRNRAIKDNLELFERMKNGEFEEGKYLPAISIGLRDFIGTGWYSSEYIVGTKSIGHLELTAGIGFGRLAQRDPFANPLSFLSSKFDINLIYK